MTYFESVELILLKKECF